MLIHGAERGDVFVDGVVQTTTYLRSIVTCHLPTTILFSLGAQVSDSLSSSQWRLLQSHCPNCKSESPLKHGGNVETQSSIDSAAVIE